MFESSHARVTSIKSQQEDRLSTLHATFLCSWDVDDSLVGQLTRTDLVTEGQGKAIIGLGSDKNQINCALFQM